MSSRFLILDSVMKADNALPLSGRAYDDDLIRRDSRKISGRNPEGFPGTASVAQAVVDP